MANLRIKMTSIRLQSNSNLGSENNNEEKVEQSHNYAPIEMTDVWEVYGRQMEMGKKEEKTSLDRENRKKFADVKEGGKKVTFMVEEKKEGTNSPSSGNNKATGRREEKASWAMKKSVPLLVPGLA